MPSRCTVSTTGHAAPCPNGDRATSAESSRRIATRSSTNTGTPDRQVLASDLAGLRHVGRHPHAATVVAAAHRLNHDRSADMRRERVESVQIVGPSTAA